MTRTWILSLGVLALAGGSLLWAQAPPAAFAVAEYKDAIEGDREGAIAEYLKVAQTADPAVAAQALWRAAEIHESIGQGAEAERLYRRIADDYARRAPAIAAAAGGRLAGRQLAFIRGDGGEPVTRQVWKLENFLPRNFCAEMKEPIMRTSMALLITIAALCSGTASAQSSAAPPAPAFEVATVHASPPRSSGRLAVFRGDRFEARGQTLVRLIAFAYGVNVDRVVGGPNWLDFDLRQDARVHHAA